MAVRSATLAMAALLWSVTSAAQPSAPTDEFRDLLQRGFQFHQRGQYADSLPALRRAWELDRTDYFVNLLLGVDLLRTGKRAEAFPFLKEASRQRPQEEFPYEYLGESQAGLAQYADAAISYRTAAQVAPQSAQANMALVDYSLARFAAMARELRSSQAGLAAEYRLQALARPLTDASRRQLLQRAAALDEDSPGVWSELAISDLANGDQAAAIRDAARAMAKNPSDLRAWEAEALLAASKGNWAAATAKLNAIGRRSPAALAHIAADWPPGLLPPGAAAGSGAAADLLQCVQEGRKRCGAHQLRARLPGPERVSGRSAELLFREQRWEALGALLPTSGSQKNQFYFRGAALVRTGDCDSAIPLLERSLGTHPWAVDAMMLLSWCYALQVGETEKRVEQGGGDPVLVHIMRGDVLLRLQANSQAAIAEYRAAVDANPRHAGALDRLAEAQLGAGQMDAARTSAEAALRLDAHRSSARRTLAEIAMQERDYAAALPYLRLLAAADPGDAGIRVQLGTACAQTGSLEEALEYLAPALQHGYPDQKGSLHYLLGTVLKRLGRAEEAARAFESARQISDAYERTPHQGQDDRP